MNNTSSTTFDSVEISLSKFTTAEEMSINSAYDLDEKSRHISGEIPDAISNERIRKGDTLLNTYEVISDAILGGMGSVWKVHHNSWDSVLAMKRPQPKFFSEGSALRKTLFVKECENWINLGMHPNIVACYYVREIGGVPTVFSEWMENGSLRERIRDGSLYEGTDEEVHKRIQDIAMQSACGLKYSHDNGLLHQDVKPGNLLVTNGWDVKVADFGLAASARESEEENSQNSNAPSDSGAAAGNINAAGNTTSANAPIRSAGYTLEYCPREQMEGAEPRNWMDLYAWTLIVLEMYAGKRLWKTGPEALEMFSGSEESVQALFDTFRVPVPDRMRKLLCACIKFKGRAIDEKDPGDWLLYGNELAEHSGGMQKFLRQFNFLPVEERVLDFEAVVFELKHIYFESFREEYPRPNADAARDTAANLNNRALSFLDLHQPARAEKLWEAALAKDPNHPDSRFNRTLFNVRAGKSDGGQVLQYIASRSDYVLSDEQFLYQELGKNQRISKKNMARFGLHSEDISHAALSGNDLLIAGVTEKYSYECDYHIYKVRKKDGSLLEIDPMDEIRDLCQWVYGIFLNPDAALAVVFLEDQTVALYDTRTRRIVRTSARHPIEDVQEYRVEFSRDSSMLFMYADRHPSYLIILPTMAIREVVGLTYVCRPLQGGFLFRGSQTVAGTEMQSLWLVKADGHPQNVFRFERPLETISENRCEPAPFLYYAFKDEDSGFYLDETYQKIDLDKEFFRKMECVRFYAPGLQMIITGSGQNTETLTVWDLSEKKELSTVECTSDLWQDQNLLTEFSYFDRNLLLCKMGRNEMADVNWYEITLPKRPEDIRTASWRLSHVESFVERLKEEQAIRELHEQFRKYWFTDADYHSALKIFRECGQLTAFSGSPESVKMEELLEKKFTKSGLRAVLPAGEVLSPPEFCLESGVECVCMDVIYYALFNPDKPQEGIRKVLSEGDRGNLYEFPEETRHVFLRGEHFYAFTEDLACTEYDQFGEKIKEFPGVAADDEKSGSSPLGPLSRGSLSRGPLSRLTRMFRGSGQSPRPKPVLMDLDYYGQNLLYLRSDQWLVQRNLATGSEEPLRECAMGEIGRYLSRDSFIVPRIERENAYCPDDPDKSPYVTYIDRYDLEGSHYLRDSYELNYDRQKHLHNLSLRMNQNRTSLIAEADGRDPETHEPIRITKIIRAYGREDALEFIKKPSEKLDLIFLPGGEIICGHTEDEVWIRSLRNNYTTPDFSIAVQASRVLFRPDGRYLYILLQEDGREVWKAFRLEFEY